MLHRKGRDVHHPGKPVLFEAGNIWRRKRWVGEGADFDPDEVRCGVKHIVDGRTAHRAEVMRSPLAVAVAIRDRLRALDGKLPRRRFAFNRDLLFWESRVYGKRAARRTVIPWAELRAIVSIPSCWLTIWCATESPRPVPLFFVVKKGSKILSRFFSSMPPP
jgi:hypothetical protein